jgi:hypothetical protein
MKWVKEECLECDCFRVDGCDECEHRDPVTEECSSSNWPRGQCPEEECVLVRLEHKLFLARDKAEAQELRLAAYREALEAVLDCWGRYAAVEVGDPVDAIDRARALLANPDGSGIVARLKAGDAFARAFDKWDQAIKHAVCKGEPPEHTIPLWQAVLDTRAALADYDRAVGRDA